MTDGSTDNAINNVILYVADNPFESHGIRTLFESHGYSVQCRDTFVSGLQFLMVQEPELVIVDHTLEGNRGLELCHTVRTDSSYHSVPVLLLGKDSKACPLEIKAFEYGVDDFIRTPMVSQVCLARAVRLMKRNVTDALGASLSVQVNSKELPGILQYLEVELKTGKLNISFKDRLATLFILQGRLVNAEYEGLEAPEIITETLCWPMCQVTLTEGELKPEEIMTEYQLTGLIMNCVVEVDEYNEIIKHLPSDDVTFLSGKRLDPGFPEGQQRVYHAALQGYSVDELVHDIDPSERRATMWLNQLVEEQYLSIGPAAFEDYVSLCHKSYTKGRLASRLVEVRNNLAALVLPIRDHMGLSGVGLADWMSPVPKLVVIGDNQDHLTLLEEALKLLYANLTQKRMPSRQLSRTTDVYRIDFGNKGAIDVLILPTFLRNEAFDAQVEDGLEDAFSVIHMASAQDRDSSRAARRVQKVVRRRFRGAYFHVVSRIKNADGKCMFKINCQHCGFKLAVDMDEAGFSGDCPVCGKTISIPESMDNLYHSLHLQEELPVVTIELADPVQVRDLLLLVLDTVLNYCVKPDPGGRTDDLKTEVRGRIGKHVEKTAIEVAETQFINLAVEDIEQTQTQAVRVGKETIDEQPPLGEDPSAFSGIPLQAVDEEDTEGDDHGEVDTILDLLNQSDNLTSTSDRLDDMMLDDMVDDDDDIDDFIESVSRQDEQ